MVDIYVIPSIIIDVEKERGKKIMEKTINFEGKVLHLVIVEDGNWNIYYCDEDKQLYYIAKKKGCGSGWFGDLGHLKRITIKFGYSYEYVTEKGIELGIDKIFKLNEKYA